MQVHGTNKNHPKYGCIHLLPPVLRSEIPINIKIMSVLFVVPANGTIGTVLGLYHHRHLEEIIHQPRHEIITLFHHLTPPNMI